MQRGYMIAGQKLTINGKPYVLDRLFTDKWQIEDERTKEISHIDIEEFRHKYEKGEIEYIVQNSKFVPESITNSKNSKIAAHLDLYPLEEQVQMKRTRIFLESYLKKYGDYRSQKVMAAGVKDLWNDEWGSAPHPATGLRWLKRYIESSKNILALGMANYRKGNNKPRIDELVSEHCQSAIEKIYLKQERGSINATLVEACKTVDVENRLRPSEMKLLKPTKSYIRALINLIPQYDKHVRRYGKNAAEHKFRNAVHGVVCEHALQRVEVDHTRLDIVLVDQETGVVIGRPWLTLMLDVYTRSILSFSLSFDPPSHMTVARAVKMALLPKVNLKDRWPRIKNDWPMYGCMDEIVVDNGFEFHCESLETACYQLGIRISFCPRKKGWWKARIERCIGTLNRAVTDGMPGRTFANITERGDYNSSANAAITLKSMEEIVAKWIVDVYHQSTHSELGEKPHQAWLDAIDEADIPLVANPNTLDAVMGVVALRVLSHRGIEINSLVYNCAELGAIRQQFGDIKDIVIKWNPEDLSYIHVLPPDGSTIRVPVITKFTNYAANLTLYQHEHFRAYSKKYIEGKDNVDALNEAKAEIREIAEANMHKKSKKTRIHSHRLTAKQAKAIDTKVTFTEKVQGPPVLKSTGMERPKFNTKLSNRALV